MNYTVTKRKGRWWVIRPHWHPKPWIAEHVCVTWTEAMTHARKAAMTSQNGPQSEWHKLIDNYVEDHYKHVMPPWQRDLVKQVAKGQRECDTARPFIQRLCERIAREVVAVLAAQD